MGAVKRLSIARAKARFAECVRLAERGGWVVLTRHGREVARLGPLERPGLPRRGTGPASSRPNDSADPDGEISEDGVEYRVGHSTASVLGEAPVPQSRTARREALERFFEEAVWDRVPPEALGSMPTKAEREKILGGLEIRE